jgi:hypothetical protein
VVKTAPVEYHVPAITEPNISQIPYTETPVIIPYSWNMLTIEGATTPVISGVDGSAFSLYIDTSPFSISMKGAFDVLYRHHIQRKKDILEIGVKNAYSFTDTSITTGFTFDVMYKNWLFDIQDKVPFFIQGGIDPYITTAVSPSLPSSSEEVTFQLDWANSGFTTKASVQPVIGVGIGRMYNIDHLVTARIILRSLGLDASDETVHKAAAILAKENQYMHTMSADFSQNYRKYYRDVLKALGMEGRHIDLLSLEESQIYEFDKDKFAFSRTWFEDEDLNIGGELSLSIAPTITYSTPSTTMYPDFTLTLREEYSRITLQDRLYVKLEAEQSLLQYNTLWIEGMLGAELRYYPRYSRIWFAFGFQDTVQLDVNTNTILNSQKLDLSAHYLITPNFMVFGQFDTIDFASYEFNIGGKIRIM